jgi:hypothetical protein
VLILSDLDAKTARSLKKLGDAKPYRPAEPDGPRYPHSALLPDLQAELFYGQQITPGRRRLVVWSQNGADPRAVAGAVFALWYGNEGMVHQVASTDTMPGTVVFDWQVEAIEERTNK